MSLASDKMRTSNQDETRSMARLDNGVGAHAEGLPLTGKLGGLSLPRQVLALALWPFLQNLMSVAVGFADMIMAGRMVVGDGAPVVMDVMGVALYLMWLLMIIQSAMATGAVALVSRFVGARDMNSANLALGQSLLLGLVAGAFSGVLVWLMVPLMAEFFSMDELAAEMLISYMRIAALSAPFSGVMMVASSSLRGYGDTARPFMAMLLVNVVNVATSWYCISSLGWGVEGLAVGTVLGWVFGAVFILWFLLPRSQGSSEEVFGLYRENLRYEPEMLWRVWSVGWPSMIEILVMWSVHIAGVYYIGRLSGGALGAHGMAVRLESISFMPGFAIGMAANTLVGQYLGANDKQMAKKAVRYCWVLALVTMGGSGLVISYFNTEFLMLFGNVDPDQFDMAARIVRFIGCLQVFTATMIVMKMSLRGAGATREVTIYSFGSQVVIRVLALWLIVQCYELSLLNVWQLFAVDTVVQSLIFVYLHFKGDWTEVKV